MHIALALGYRGAPLVDKGSYVVDEAEHTGAPDQLTLRARSADLGQTLRQRREQSWHAGTVGAIVGAIAQRNGLRARIDATLAARTVAHIDQTNESDLNFLTRLGRLHDALATVKAGHLLFLPVGRATTSSGQGLPTVVITRADGDQHRYQQADRDHYSGVRAYWHSASMGNRRSVLVGTATHAKTLKDTLPTEAEARRAAQSEWQRIQRGAATLALTLAHGNPLLVPETPLEVRSFKPQIDGTGWLVVHSEHSLDGSGGYTTSIEAETRVVEDTVPASVE